MRRILIVPVIAGILLTLSACGAKEEATSTAPTTQATARSSDSDQSTTSEKKTSTTESGDDTTDTTEGDSGSGSGLPDGFENDCIAISTLYVTVMAQSTSLMMPGAVSAEELEQLDKDLEEARSKAEIPDEIAEDFEIWSAAWAEFGDAMNDIGEGGLLNPANAEKYDAATKIIEDPEVEAAGDRIEAFVTKNCAGGGLVEE